MNSRDWQKMEQEEGEGGILKRLARGILLKIDGVWKGELDLGQ